MKSVMKNIKKIINEEEKYRKMKDHIRMIKSQRNDELNEEDKRNKINKINRENNNYKQNYK